MTLEQIGSMPFLFVDVNDLVKNKSKYHGKWVETEAYFSKGFEKSELSYDSTIMTTDGTLTFRVPNALWVEFHYSHPYYQKVPDSINHKLVRVRGFFDTTKTGHLGYYSAELSEAYFMKIVKVNFN